MAMISRDLAKAVSEVKVLGPGDERVLVDFLEGRLDTGLFLLANSEAAGLEDHNGPLEGTYAATFEDDRMTAVAAHYWNGILIVQGHWREADAGPA